VPRGSGDLAVGDFVQHIKVAVAGRLLNQAADGELVLLGGHGLPRSCPRGDCRALAGVHTSASIGARPFPGR
jgi:hypothetical protein